MCDKIDSLAIRDWSCADFALRVRPSLAEFPVDLAGICGRRNPFVFARAKHNRMVHLCETGGRPAGLQLPAQLSGLRYKSINISAALRSAAAIGGDEDQVLIDERIAMKAAR